ARRARELLNAENVRIYLRESEGDRLICRFAEPPESDEPISIGLSELGPEVGRGSWAARVAVSLVAGDELLGALVADGTRELDLARTVANQAAVAIKKIQVLERLTEKNLIKDFFEELAEHRGGEAIESRARRLGCDLAMPQLVLAAVRVDDALERGIASLSRATLIDRRDESLRALVPMGTDGAGRPRRDDRRRREARRVRPRSRSGAARHARGVPRPPRQHQHDVRGALRASEHASPEASPNRRPHGDRSPPRRLADGRDRRQARP